MTGDLDLRNNRNQKGVVEVRNLEKILLSLAALLLLLFWSGVHYRRVGEDNRCTRQWLCDDAGCSSDRSLPIHTSEQVPERNFLLKMIEPPLRFNAVLDNLVLVFLLIMRIRPDGEHFLCAFLPHRNQEHFHTTVTGIS